MTVVSELTVELEGREVGLGALLTKVDAQTQKAADSAIRLQQQYARLAQSQGNTAGATSILSSALTNNGGASERALVGVATQLERTRAGSAGLGQTVAGLGGQLSQLGGTVGGLAGQIGNLAGSFGTLGTIGAVIGIGKIGLDLAQTGANADLVRQRFDGLAAAAGTTGDALLAALRAASGGEINNLNLELAANRAQLLGVADSAQEFSVLMNIARDRAQQMGISTTQAFNDLVTGLGRGSALILDNLGITVSVTEANEAYAASLGKSAKSLTEAEQKQALINAVLTQGQASLNATGGAIDSNAAAFTRAGAAIQNTGNAIGAGLSTVLAPAATGLARLLEGTSGLSEAAHALSVNWQAGVASNNAYIAAIQAGATDAEAAAARTAAYNAEVAALSSGWTAAGGAIIESSTAVTDIEQQRIEAMNAAQAATAAATAAVAEHTAALDEEAGKALLSAANADELAIKKQELAQAAQAAAQAVLDGGGNIEAEAGRLAASSSLVDQLTAAYIRLAQAQGAAGAAAASNRVPADAQRAMGIAQQNAAALERQRVLSSSLANAERDLAAARNIYGASSQQAYEAETRVLKARQSTQNKGGGGGGRVPQAEKERRQLLTDEQKYQDKQDDLERDHADRRLAILQKYYDEARQAAAAFAQGQLDSAASFYDALGDVASNKIQQQASAEYEAAVQEAAALGGEAGRRYLEEKERVILARAKRQAEIEQAEQAGDKDKAEYARGVDAKYRAAEDAKLQAIKDGGDQAAAERDAALAEEDARYAEASDKAATSAERSAERRALASGKSAQAVDQEAQKVEALSRAYDKVGTRQGAAQPTTAGATTPAATATTGEAGATTPNAPADLAALLAKLDEVKQAIAAAAGASTADTDGLRAAVVAATQGGAGDIVRAVRSLSNSSVIAG